MKNHQWLHLVGVASGMGSNNVGSRNGPAVLRDSSYLTALQEQGAQFSWDAWLSPEAVSLSREAVISELCQRLAAYTRMYTRMRQRFAIIGGDHSCAIGTWSGVSAGLADQGPLGLLWIDAHMDSHTPETTESGAIHGMPLAVLLGYGHPLFTRVLNATPKVLPQHVCLIGVRSYESGEYELLKRLGVRVFYMEDIHRRGLSDVFSEALNIVQQNTAGYGVSFDLDALDPEEAPGVTTPVPGGLSLQEISKLLMKLGNESNFLGFELTEFNPEKDRQKHAEQCMIRLLQALSFGE